MIYLWCVPWAWKSGKWSAWSAMLKWQLKAPKMCSMCPCLTLCKMSLEEKKSSLCVRTKTSNGKVITRLNRFKDLGEWNYHYLFATSPGGGNHTSVFWKGAAQNITCKDKVSLFWGICSSPTCLPVSQWNYPFLLLSALILRSGKAQPRSTWGVLWLAEEQDSARICC